MAIKTLQPDWLTSGVHDFEYKQYLLLAYLQYVKEHFDQARLYPPLAELVSHYNHLMELKQNQDKLASLFPKSLSEIDLKDLKMHYKELVEDDESLKIVRDLMEFSIPRLRSMIDEGRDIYQFVEENVELDTVGLLPMYRNEGYFFLEEEKNSEIFIYRYQLSLIEATEETYRSLKTMLIQKEKKSIARTLSQVKMELTKKFTELPNPATYVFRSALKFPLNETVLPVAKRILIREIKPSAA